MSRLIRVFLRRVAARVSGSEWNTSINSGSNGSGSSSNSNNGSSSSGSGSNTLDLERARPTKRENRGN